MTRLAPAVRWAVALSRAVKRPVDQMTISTPSSFQGNRVPILRRPGQGAPWYNQAVQWMDKNKPSHEDLRRFRTEAAELLGLKGRRLPRSLNWSLMDDVTHILHAIDAGDPQAADRLLPLVYDELRKLAAARMAAERPDHTLNATGLVHEAYLRLVGGQRFDSRAHFFAAAAEAMRRILVEAARRRATLKRGGPAGRVPLEEVEAPAAADDDQLLAVHEALDELAKADPDAATLVKLRFFAGLTATEAADALGMSVRSAHDLWAYARSWLRRNMREESNSVRQRTFFCPTPATRRTDLRRPGDLLRRMVFRMPAVPHAGRVGRRRTASHDPRRNPPCYSL